MTNHGRKGKAFLYYYLPKNIKQKKSHTHVLTIHVELLFFEVGSIAISEMLIDFGCVLLIFYNLIRTVGDTEREKFCCRNTDTEIFWWVTPLFWLHPVSHMLHFVTYCQKRPPINDANKKLLEYIISTEKLCNTSYGC